MQSAKKAAARLDAELPRERAELIMDQVDDYSWEVISAPPIKKGRDW